MLAITTVTDERKNEGEVWTLRSSDFPELQLCLSGLLLMFDDEFEKKLPVVEVGHG